MSIGHLGAAGSIQNHHISPVTLECTMPINDPVTGAVRQTHNDEPSELEPNCPTTDNRRVVSIQMPTGTKS
jgi:hypothetical protein